VLPPDVNESSQRFSAVGTDIRFGLGAIRNVGANVVESIIKTRRDKGRYTSFNDFLTKAELVCCNKRVLESLIKAGAFDSFGDTRRALCELHEEAVDAVIGLKRQEAMGQFDLFGGDDDAPPADDTSPLAHLKFTAEDWPRKQQLGYEREMLGLYVSAHPLDGTERILRKHAPKPIVSLLEEAPAEGEIVVAGMISALERRVNKNGEPWAIVTLEDLDAAVEVLFFAKSYSVLAADLVEDAAVAVKGRVNWREGKMSVFGSAVVPLDISDAEHNPGAAPPVVLLCNVDKLTEDVISELKHTLAVHRGDTPVHLKVCYQQRTTLLAIDDYPIKVSPAFLGEIKAIPGIVLSA
jgi:DNA polymerase-3 subunit alpha